MDLNYVEVIHALGKSINEEVKNRYPINCVPAGILLDMRDTLHCLEELYDKLKALDENMKEKKGVGCSYCGHRAGTNPMCHSCKGTWEYVREKALKLNTENTIQ